MTTENVITLTEFLEQITTAVEMVKNSGLDPNVVPVLFKNFEADESGFDLKSPNYLSICTVKGKAEETAAIISTDDLEIPGDTSEDAKEN